MVKRPWMREIELEHGWADLWRGAWHKQDGLWRRVEVLADLWLWSDKLCRCCLEPKILTPDGQYLACQWTGQLTPIKTPNRKHVLSGVSIFPCPACYGDIWERRIIEGLTTVRIRTCRACGRSTRTVNELDVSDYLPVGYIGRYWQQETQTEYINRQLAEIKRLLKEQRR